MIFLALLFLIFGFASADDLYPRCSGKELSVKAKSGETKPLGNPVKTPGQILFIECLAFEVRSMSEKGICEIPHQTMLPFRLFVSASGTEDGKPFDDEYDVKDVVGGSINRITITARPNSVFKLLFKNTNSNPDCLMSVRAIFTTRTLPSAEVVLPSIVNVDPRTAFEARPTFFVTKDGPIPHKDALVFLVPIEDKCMSSSHTTALTRVTDPDTLKKYTTPYIPISQQYSVWSADKLKADNYKVCATLNSTTPGHEIALLTVFGGNPMYFEVAKGSGKNGRIFTGVPITLLFHGYDLDTRPYMDRAKLVDESTTCDGPPAGGVPMTTDLGPADSFGPETVTTEWTFAILREGGYKVCYHRARDTEWTEVPIVDDMPQGAVVTPTTTTKPPVPTHPRTKNSCPLAKPREKPPKHSQSYLKLTMKQPSVPSYFRSLLSETICVPAASLIFASITKAQTGAVLFLDIICPEGACGSQDRKNYLLEISKEATKEFIDLGVVAIDEVSTNGIMTRDDHEELMSVIKKRFGLVFTMGCITLIIIAAVCVYGVIQYRKNQHHFIQFGVDDDDMDMDEPPPRQAVPASDEA